MTREATVETCLIGVLVIWAVASLGCVLGVRGIRGFAARLGQLHVLVEWTMFGARGDVVGAPVFWFEYCEADGAGKASEWIKFADGSVPWVWHAFLWHPRRRLADRIRMLAKEIRHAHARNPPATVSLKRATGIIADHLETVSPARSCGRRRIRLVMQISTAGTNSSSSSRPRDLQTFELEPVVPDQKFGTGAA